MIMYQHLKIYLKKNNSFTVHHYHIQTLCRELCKDFSGQSRTLFNDLFERKNIHYNFCSQSDFVIPQAKTIYKG